MKVSEDQIEQIREATNIVDLVSEHVRLKKRGRNYSGLCPFHNEKTPSFSVLEDKGIFKCFGCGKGGDVFSYVMTLEGLTFPEAIQRLAKRANIEIETEESDREQQARNERETLYNTLRAAATWYFRSLRAPEGVEAMDYLRKRGLEAETIRKFGLGYAPGRSGQLTQALIQQGYSIEMLEAAGLIARQEGSDWYERFRGRVIFPVFSATGRIVGFGGRILPNTSSTTHLAKYINSPDTTVYHKSQILYGLYQAKDAIRRAGFAILVEGYADVIAVHQGGIENVVAASGTSLTVDQLNLLRRYTTSVVLLFDADAAGKNAAIRGIELAIEAGFDVNTVVLPSGEDPDSFIRAKGASAFESAIEHHQSFIETKAQWFEEQGDFRDPGRMAVAVRSIVETIAKVPDPIKRALFIQKLGDKFHLSEQMLTIELQKCLTDKAEQNEKSAHTTYQLREPQVEESTTISAPVISQPVSRQEAAILEALLSDPEGVAKFLDASELDLDLFNHPIVRELIGYIMQKVEEGEPPTINQLIQDYRRESEYESVITACTIHEEAQSSNWAQKALPDEMTWVTIASQSYAGLMLNRIRLQIAEITMGVKRTKDQPVLEAFFSELHRLQEREKNLQAQLTSVQSPAFVS